MSGQVHCQLWMGSLEPYMTETFILNAFRKMGESPLGVKIMRNKMSGEPAGSNMGKRTGYCFVHFSNDEEAIQAMHKLNSKSIPGTNPTVRFRLNNASRDAHNINKMLVDREFSVWVGDLSPDVDDYNLYRVFSAKYNTIKTAKVILDNSGFSKCYGFVRFGSEGEMRDCLNTMNGYIGLGTKPLKISNAVPKPKGMEGTSIAGQPASGDYAANYYDPSTYWQNYANWQGQGYYDQSQQQNNSFVAPSEQGSKKEDELELIEHSIPLDIDKMNREKIDQDCSLWDAIESSKWLPCETFDIPVASA